MISTDNLPAAPALVHVSFPLGLLPIDDFMTMVKEIHLGENGSRDGFLYDFTFESGREPVLAAMNNGGPPLYNEDELATIEHHYTMIVVHLVNMTNKGFVLDRLCFMNNHGRSGIAFSYKTPQDRRHAARYIRGGEPDSFIPVDFLRDLEHIPYRHG